ncbi:hypothetical protein ACFXKC_51815 [Streptomyces sp. NPDC059340]
MIGGDDIGTERVQGRSYAGRHLLGERHQPRTDSGDPGAGEWGEVAT